jgi:hypothetical protein
MATRHLACCRRWPRWAYIVTVALVYPAVYACPAHADAAAGREAYQRGDYARAGAEWQRAADRGDPDAELGIGELFEFGLGDWKQDYRRANDWYQKAAAQSGTSAEAQYRLALIWAAGSPEFPADFIEAYKWVALAATSESVWGSLATDLKTQLEKVMPIDQQGAGRRRAESWKQTLNAPASPPPDPPKQGGSGCPGWPFPTLPCTDQPPPIPGQPSAPRPAPEDRGKAASLDELTKALAPIPCAALRAQISARGAPLVSGSVPDAEQRSKVVQVAERLFPGSRPEINVDIVPPPVCDALARLNALPLNSGLRLQLANGKTELLEGDPIKVEVGGPAYAVDLRIDYFSLDGRVLHLWPNARQPSAKLGPAETRVFWQAPTGEPFYTGGEPFGTELIAAIATPRALDLGASRPAEPAADYLRDLGRALDRIGPMPSPPSRVATLVVKTRSR